MPGPAAAGSPAATGTEPWLVVVDPQRIFAEPSSPWASPMFDGIVGSVRRLAERFAGRVVVTRFVAPPQPRGSWVPYYREWPFAQVPADDPLYAVVDPLADLGAPVVTATTFGKWPALAEVTGPEPHLVLTGVATDCCVLATALPAADAGATLRVVADACAGSAPENHARALAVMALFAPQITLTTSVELLG
ncbi:cysteine hydrolase [Georgenia sp. TF02-10]|uniref:cysteine hydrolase family protein n=1 Tax=Georgenia sp. TF02-10 TaxID=2917725 RepID=UPI001FA74CAD|nr:cysteine hydrolase [Georgenia sp. TF02-10]UNX56412.1 cysteine hydrolase [Georgenia sp. TF02-10]